MEHQLAFSKIHIIEWLWKIDPETGEPDRRTGKEICKELQRMLVAAKSPIQVIPHRVESKAAFLARLERIQQDFEHTKRFPLIQIETHGDEDGIGLTADDGLSWPEFMKALTPLNEATGLRLPVFLSACHGMWGIRMVRAMQRAPFFALMGPKKAVEPGAIVRGMCAFYRKAIVEREGLKAMDYMNSIVNPDEDIFRIYNCEQLFRDIWDWYLTDIEAEDYITRILETKLADDWAQGKRDAVQVAKLRDYANAYVRDYPKRFEEARRIFFMIDQYPGNHERFDLVLKKVGDTLEISESSSTDASLTRRVKDPQ
jgi:hypothetical protein